MVRSGILKQHNLKHTEAREAVYSIISQAKKPVDVQTVVDLLKKLGIKADQATVYRTIQTFVDHEIFNQVELREGKFRYELSTLPHHHHLVCTNCGRIEDIKECGMEDVIKTIRKTTQFNVNQHNADFFGLCAQCIKKE